MDAKEARSIYRERNRTLSLEEKIRVQANNGFAGMSIDKLNENDPKVKQLQEQGYLISHSNNKTYITWDW